VSAPERTEEQQAADEQLNAAVEAVVAAYFPLEGIRVIEEFVIVVAATEMEGEQAQGGTLELFRDGSIPSWKAVGLLDSALARLRNSAL